MNLISLLVHPIAPLSIILIVGLIFSGFLLWKEFGRNSSNRVLRIFATIVIIAALFGLALRPSSQSEASETPVILLTKGYDRLKVDSLAGKHPNFKIIQSKNAKEYPNAEIVSVTNLSEYAAAVRFVLGEGLPRSTFDQYADLNFIYSQARKPQGITAIHTDSYFVSHKGIISGKFNNSSQNSQLVLKGPGGREDSIQFTKPGESSFSFSFAPRQSGRFIYELIFTNDSGKVQIEKVPIEIFPERKLNILFLQQFPSTEVRYLKDFLVDHGHGVVLRYQVSKNLYRYEFGNHSSQPINQLSEDQLSVFDLLIISINDLKGLDSGERKAIEGAVRSGMGAIVLLDEVPDPKVMQPLLTLSFKKIESDTVQLEGINGKHTLSSLPAVVTSNRPTQAITMAKGSRTLSGYQFLDMGKIGFQSLNETYPMILKGFPEAYSEIWTPLIEQTARNANASFKIILDDPYPLLVNDPIAIQVISAGKQPTLQMDGIAAPLIEDVVVDDLWHSKIWVGKSGWHQLMVLQDSTTQNFYVTQNDTLGSLALANQIKSNLTHHSDEVDLQSTSTKIMTKEIPYWIYFVMFLLAGGYLWLEPRI